MANGAASPRQPASSARPGGEDAVHPVTPLDRRRGKFAKRQSRRQSGETTRDKNGLRGDHLTP